MQSLHKADPDSALHQLHGRCIPIPVIKITHQRYCLGVGGPKDKAVSVQFRHVVAAIAQPCFLSLAGVEKVYIPIGNIVQIFCIHAHISLV